MDAGVSEQEEDIFYADARQYELFQQGTVWKDIKHIVQGWKESCLLDLSDPNKVATLEALADMQGRIHICELLLSLPESIIETIKLSKLQEENENGSN
jgi:hypothetical protein